MTSSERARASRKRLGVRTVGLDAEAMAAAKAIRNRDGDRTLVAAIKRVLISSAAGRR